LAQQHHVAQVSLMLILPKGPHTSHRVGSWDSLKSFGEVTNTTWAIEETIQGTLSVFAKFSINSETGSRKEEEWKMQSQNPFYFSTSESRCKATSPTSKVKLSFSCTNLFKIAIRAWSLCACTYRVITSCNSWSTEAKFRLCSRMSKRLAWKRLLTVLTTKNRQSIPRVREEYMTRFMHIFSTNKVPWLVLWFSWAGTHFGRN
jgi:hypothetical protein